MSLETAWQNITQHLTADAESVKARIEQDLPEVAAFISGAAANPVVQALSAAAHLNGAPEVLQTIASMITQIEQKLGAEAAAREAAEQAAAAAQAPDAVPPA